MRAALPVLLLLALVLPAAAPAPAPAAEARLQEYALLVDGEVATGLLGVPAGAPRSLVVYGHGYGNTVQSWRGHLLAAAERGHLAVAMDYSPWFDLDQGAAWTNAAAVALAEAHGLDLVVLFGVSMGAATTGLALAEAPRRGDGSALYDAWFAIEPLSALPETWAQARLIGHPAAGQIEADTGGTPWEQPQAYARRSSAYRPLDLAAQVPEALVVHAVNDGLVPHNQGRQLSLALRAAGMTVDFVTVLRGQGSEGYGTMGTAALGLPNPLGLAGHGWEGSSTHPVLATSFDRLWAYLDGAYRPSGAEVIVDDGLGILPR